MARWQIASGLLLASMAAGGVVAQTSVAALLSTVPECVLPCITRIAIEGNCSLGNVQSLADCFCTSLPLQLGLSTCTQKSCTVPDQIRAATSQSDLCAGYPRQSRVGEVQTVSILAIVLTIPVVLARCVARFQISGQIWSDDWTAIMALVLLIGAAGTELASAQLGFGLHFWDVDVHNFTPLLKMFYSMEIIYTWTKNVAKVSILLLYKRVFTAVWFRRGVYVLLAYSGVLAVTWTFVLAFQCNPVALSWDHSLTGRCLNVNVIGYLGAILSVAEDVAIIILPLPELRKLQISTTKRIGVGVMLAIASFAVVTSIIRLKYLVDFSKSYDASYDNVDAAMWSFIEIICTVICGSLPPLRPWLSRLSPFKGTSIGGRNKTGGTYGCASRPGLISSYMHSQLRTNDRGHEEGQSHSSIYALSSLSPPSSSSAGSNMKAWAELNVKAVGRNQDELRSTGSEADLIASNSVRVTYDIQISSDPRPLDELTSRHSVRVTENPDQRLSLRTMLRS